MHIAQSPCANGAMHNHQSIPSPSSPPSSIVVAPILFSPLPVRLLVPRTGTWTTELLGLRSAVVGDEEGAVVGDEGLLQLVLAVLIDELLVVGDLQIYTVSRAAPPLCG